MSRLGRRSCRPSPSRQQRGRGSSPTQHLGRTTTLPRRSWWESGPAACPLVYRACLPTQEWQGKSLRREYVVGRGRCSKRRTALRRIQPSDLPRYLARSNGRLARIPPEQQTLYTHTHVVPVLACMCCATEYVYAASRQPPCLHWSVLCRQRPGTQRGGGEVGASGGRRSGGKPEWRPSVSSSPRAAVLELTSASNRVPTHTTSTGS